MKHSLIKRTLIIMPEFLEWILSGHKTWEIRTQPTNIRETVALSEKGAKRILGVCTLANCLGPLTVDEYIKNARKMNRSKKELKANREEIEIDFLIYDHYAWVLTDVKRLAKPIPFENPSGAVTWAKLPPEISHKIRAK
jgi:hypothetical protein